MVNKNNVFAKFFVALNTLMWNLVYRHAVMSASTFSLFLFELDFLFHDVNTFQELIYFPNSYNLHPLASAVH